MSNPTEPQTGSEALMTEPRAVPKCGRCRHHGMIVPKKGHTRFCPFASCPCCKCSLISQRSGITAQHRSLGTGPETPWGKAKWPGRTTGVKEGTPAVTGTSNPAANPSFWNLANPQSWTNGGGGGGGGGAGGGGAGGGGGLQAGVDTGDEPPPEFHSCFLDSGQMGPVPLIPCPFVDSKDCPSSARPPQRFPPSMQWRQPAPVYSFRNGPLVFPAPLQGATSFFAPAGPQNPPNWTQVIIGFPPLPQPRTVQGPLRATQYPQLEPPNK